MWDSKAKMFAYGVGKKRQRDKVQHQREETIRKIREEQIELEAKEIAEDPYIISSKPPTVIKVSSAQLRLHFI